MQKRDLNDFQLISEYLAGDLSSFEYLINRHKSRVFSYILKVVKNRELAEDIFQDTFIKVIKSLHAGKYSEEGRFVSWVMRISHNLIIDFYRKEKHLQTVSDDDREVSLFNSSKYSDDTIEEELVTEQILKDVSAVVEFLPKDQREIIKMRFYQNLSYKEIAEQTDVSINTALGRMRYAIINMRNKVKETNLDLVAS